MCMPLLTTLCGGCRRDERGSTSRSFDPAADVLVSIGASPPRQRGLVALRMEEATQRVADLKRFVPAHRANLRLPGCLRR